MRTWWTVAASAIGTKFTQSIKARRERIRVALHSFAIWYEKHPMPTARQSDGYGQRFKTADGRANLTIQSAPNAAHDSPASFLAKKNPPSRIQYKRVTSRFFAVSSYKGDDVWYDRCNFSRRFVHCVL